MKRGLGHPLRKLVESWSGFPKELKVRRNQPTRSMNVVVWKVESLDKGLSGPPHETYRCEKIRHVTLRVIVFKS